MKTVVGSRITYKLLASERILGTTPILYAEGDFTCGVYVEYDRYPGIMRPNFSGKDLFRDFTLTRASNHLLHFNVFSTSAETWTYSSQIEKGTW